MVKRSEQEIMQNWQSDMNKVLVSVSIVTYNHENFIEDCLDSILAQNTDFVFEIVIGEDCSTDNTKEIIKKYEEKFPNIIKPIFNEINVMAQENLSNVLKVCSGKYIAHLDGDDSMLPGKLQKQVDFLENHKDCAVVFHNMKFIGEKILGAVYNNPTDEEECIIDINDFVKIGLAHWANSSKMYKKSAIPKEGLEEFQCIGDQHFHLQNARTGKIGYIPQVLGLYRKHDQGQSSQNKAIKAISCTLKDLVKTYSDAYEFGVNKSIVDKRLAFLFYDAACQYLLLRDYKDFRTSIEKSYEDLIFFNKKHKVCFLLKGFPRTLYMLKIINNLLYKIRGKQII